MKRVFFIRMLKQSEDGTLQEAYIMDEEHNERMKAFSSHIAAANWLKINTPIDPTIVYIVIRGYMKPGN